MKRLNGRSRIPAGTDANPKMGGKGKKNVAHGMKRNRKGGKHGRGKR